MLNVKISIDDGKGKNAEIELSETDNLSKLIIIQDVFKLFGIDTDIISMVSDYNKIGEAYSSFFNQVDPVEKKVKEKTENNINIKQQLTDGPNDNKEELEFTYKETKDQPDFILSGIKIDDDGTKRYRCHYKCVACWNRGTHYIYEDSKNTWCHRCKHEFSVYAAHPKGFPHQDTFGNFFRAGDFRDFNLIW